MNLKFAQDISDMMMSFQNNDYYKVKKMKNSTIFSGKNANAKDERFSICVRFFPDQCFDLVTTVYDPQNCVGVSGGSFSNNRVISDFVLNVPKEIPAEYRPGKVGCLSWPASEVLVTTVLLECIEFFKKVHDYDYDAMPVDYPWFPRALGSQCRLFADYIPGGPKILLVLYSAPVWEAQKIYEKRCKETIKNEMKKLNTDQFFRVFAELYKFSFPHFTDRMPSEKDVLDDFTKKVIVPLNESRVFQIQGSSSEEKPST